MINMEKIILQNHTYQLIHNVKDGFDMEAVLEKVTDYYEPFDYIVGDWAYGKLRLKGFYKEENPSVKKYNNIKNLEEYIEKNCAYECKWFCLEKEKN